MVENINEMEDKDIVMENSDIEMDQRPRPSSLKEIDHAAERIGRALSVRTVQRLGKAVVNEQGASKFFEFPIELRLAFYELAFVEQFDKQKAYKASAPYFRPDHGGPAKVQTSLLLTCRKIWLEANHLSFKSATHRFWFHNGPRDLQRMTHSAAALNPKNDEKETTEPTCGRTERDFYLSFFNRLTALNLTFINHVQIFGSGAWLRSFQETRDYDGYFHKSIFAARILTVTIRDSEWGPLEKAADASSTDVQWLRALLNSRNLRDVGKLNLELEMTLDKLEKLDSITAVFAHQRGKYFKRHGEVIPDQWTKVLPSNAISDSSESITYATRKITWEAVQPNDETVKHARGHIIRKNGEIDDYRTARQRFKTKARKRGGRRSMPVWNRNHWQPRYSTQAEYDHLVNEDEAAKLMEEWSDTGSLLRLI